jgi:hypothetical protein
MLLKEIIPVGAMEAVHTSETSVQFNETAFLYILEDSKRQHEE